MLRCVVAAALLCAVALATGPSGDYCGSYMGFIKGKMTVTGNEFAFQLDVAGTKSVCPKAPFTLDAATGAMNVPSVKNPTDCLGHLVKSNGLSEFSATYHAADNTIKLDAGVGSVELSKCKKELFGFGNL